jgi:iron complex outermembrane recepter protein
VALQHQFNKEVMAYALYSTGYKGQAYDITSNVTAATAATQPVPSETAKNFELGFKGNFLNNTLAVNVTAFKTKFRDYQQNSSSLAPDLTTVVTGLNTIGGVQTQGVEVDIGALVAQRLLLNASLAYTEATITEWPNAPCYNVAGSPNGGRNAECRLRAFRNTDVQDLAGRSMPNAPKVKLNLSGKYDFPLDANIKGFVTAALKYQTKTLTNINQDPDLESPERGILDVGFGMADVKDRYRVTLAVNNVRDTPYANTGFTGIGTWGTGTRTTWTPARDAFRYVSVRFDAKF